MTSLLIHTLKSVYLAFIAKCIYFYGNIYISMLFVYLKDIFVQPLQWCITLLNTSHEVLYHIDKAKPVQRYFILILKRYQHLLIVINSLKTLCFMVIKPIFKWQHMVVVTEFEFPLISNIIHFKVISLRVSTL